MGQTNIRTVFARNSKYHSPIVDDFHMAYSCVHNKLSFDITQRGHLAGKCRRGADHKFFFLKLLIFVFFGLDNFTQFEHRAYTWAHLRGRVNVELVIDVADSHSTDALCHCFPLNFAKTFFATRSSFVTKRVKCKCGISKSLLYRPGFHTALECIRTDLDFTVSKCSCSALLWAIHVA